MKTHTANTYDLIVESEDKNRTALETVIYVLFILSAVVSILQFVAQPVVVPSHDCRLCLDPKSNGNELQHLTRIGQLIVVL